MKLTYRGINYKSELPTIDMMEGEVGGQYRGHQWQVRYPRHIPVPQPVEQLKYRGNNYTTGEPAVERISAPMPTIANEAIAFPKQPLQILEQAAKVHRNNICRSLERRLQAARMQGDERLIALLENESKQLTCSMH